MGLFEIHSLLTNQGKLYLCMHSIQLYAVKWHTATYCDGSHEGLTSNVTGPDFMDSLSSRTLLRTGLNPVQSSTIRACCKDEKRH